LVILNASPLHGASIKRSEKEKAKAKVDWVNITSDKEEGEEEEEESQNEQGHEEKEDDDDEENEVMARKTMAETKGSLWSSSMGHHRANKKNLPSLNKPQILQS
jgi:hypothetical protein